MEREKALTAAEQKKTEQLEESLSLFSATLQSTADGILVLDDQGRVTNYNQKFVDMWELPNEVMDSPDDTKVLETMLDKIEASEDVFRKIKELYDDTNPTHFSEIKLKNGKIFERYLQPQMLRGKTMGGVWSFRDITDRRKAEDALKEKREELERSNADLQQFAYVSSHDLQEPLRMVAGYVKLLEKRYRGKLDADADEFITFAIEGAQRMSELINDLLAYSRVNTQGTELKPVDTNNPFNKALFNLQTAIQENEVLITHDPLPEVMGDETQLLQLFQNLMSNAIKFHGENKIHIHINAKMENDKWIFSVKDNGLGIKKEYFDRIFMVFQRLHSRTEFPGTGIGLSLCKRIVERHEGKIWVESKPGEGTTFFFSLKPVGGEQA
jgi:PAS domain S-box-containing protein